MAQGKVKDSPGKICALAGVEAGRSREGWTWEMVTTALSSLLSCPPCLFLLSPNSFCKTIMWHSVSSVVVSKRDQSINVQPASRSTLLR